MTEYNIFRVGQLGDRENMFRNGILNNQTNNFFENRDRKLNKTQSHGHLFHTNNIGDREKMFLSGIVNNTKGIPDTPKESSNGVVENGISNKQKEILNRTYSSDAVMQKNNIGDREKMFMNAVLNNQYCIPEIPLVKQQKLVRQKSYNDYGILNYDTPIFKKQASYSSDSDEGIFIENITLNDQKAESDNQVENGNPNNKNKIFNKTQSCVNIPFRSHMGDRETMFMSGILNSQNAISENLTPKTNVERAKFARQNSYKEHGILNYESGVFKKPKTDISKECQNETAHNLQTKVTENEISSNQNRALNKTQSCGNFYPRNDIGNREKMFMCGVQNITIHNPGNQKEKSRDFIRQNSYTENGILNYESTIHKKNRSVSSDSTEDADCVKKVSPENKNGNSGQNNNLNGPSGNTNGSLSGIDENFAKTTEKEVSPARSRIIARVKKSRSFALLSDATNTLPELTGAGYSERRVLVIYTGGTIGMVKNSVGVLEPIKGAFEGSTRTFPQLHDEAYSRKRFMHEVSEMENLVLPVVKDLDSRIIYKIHEKETLLDSANVTAEDWISIARDIMGNYDLYDGFVVLHGTDTLAYTASALSFMLENIGKPVVITGSQIPIFEPRSDGSDNFVSALIVAGGLNIPEVTVMFGSKLFRGNRTRKYSSHNYHAFDCPNFVPLVEFGIDIEVNNKAIFRPTRIEKCKLHERMSKNVGLIRMFPSISAAVMRAFFQPPIEGVVLETYGSGNIPSNREDILNEIQMAVKRGVIVVIITQCASGSVGAPVYETGRLIQACGVICGYDMTPETALAKLAYVLTKDEWSFEKKIEMMTSNIRGELTNINSITLEDNSLIDALASSLKINCPKRLIEVTDRVFTSLLLYAIDKEEEVTIQKIQELGAEVNSQNSEGKTPLHEAIFKENVNIVKYLLLRGSNVHVKTRCGESPLLTAIQRDQHAIIKLLLNCGAHLTSSDNLVVTELLSLAARRGSTERLESLRLAGADFGLRDEMRQSALHKAVLSDQLDVVVYLLEQGVQKNTLDILNLTPLDYARQLENNEMIRLLE